MGPPLTSRSALRGSLWGSSRSSVSPFPSFLLSPQPHTSLLTLSLPFLFLLPPRPGLGWVPPIWKSGIQKNVPEWASSFAFYLVFATLFPWLMGPIKGENFVDVEARRRTHRDARL